jgi:membrane protein DedA with SNARE-associated domain
MVSLFSHLIGNAVSSTLLLSFVVMLCAFILEDATIIIVGVLAADGTISVPVALTALYTGMLVGDIVLYCVGWLARTHPRLARYADHEFTSRFRDWLESRYTAIVFSGHFVPGLRIMAYSASGFFRFPLSRYIPTAIISGVLLESVLFTLSYMFGSFSSQWIGAARWGVAALFIGALLYIAHHNLVTYRARRDALAVSDTGAGIRKT